MRNKIFSVLLTAIVMLAGCKKDFLERYPLDAFVDEGYWTNENSVRTFSYGFYTSFFTGYSSGFSGFGRYFTSQSLNDDFAPSIPPQFTRVVPSSGGGYTFTFVRKANLFLNRVQTVPMDEEAIKHWTGVGRFFRAMEYGDLVKTFGDVPWFGVELSPTDVASLYRPRDPRTVVMDSVLADYKYAAENVRKSDGNDGLTVNRYVVLAFMSRIFLFEGTFLKYHNISQAKSKEYLEAAQWAANEVIKSAKFSITDEYRSLFNSVDLIGKKEIIMYRKYETGLVTHSLHSYVNKEPQTGASKNAVESFLAKDGLPISISPEYKGDKTIANVMADRDPRLTETFAPDLRLQGIATNYSTSGYAVRKFYNEALKDALEGNGQLNITDAPVIRFGEILLNYAEATYELGTLTQADLDKSINLLRARPGINIPKLQVIGGQPAVAGKVYEDLKRDPTVPSLLWEIRRERRTELIFEGFRLEDLKRWKKLEYTDTQAKPDINRGAWVRRASYPGLIASVKIEGDAPEGYLIPAPNAATQRTFTDPKVYLEPLPLDQIKLYQDRGVTLRQNTGW
jgi:hypothetical protein